MECNHKKKTGALKLHVALKMDHTIDRSLGYLHRRFQGIFVLWKSNVSRNSVKCKTDTFGVCVGNLFVSAAVCFPVLSYRTVGEPEGSAM